MSHFAAYIAAMAGTKGVNPKAIGERSEGQIIARLLHAGKTVLKPYGDNQRYDLVLDEGDTFVRVQCKTGRLRKGAVEFATCSSYAHRGHGGRDYRGQADVFAVYCPDNEKTYLVPVEAVGVSKCRLRVETSRNGQRDGVRSAVDYEVRWLRGLDSNQRPID
jgi:hypothetical protein